MVRHADAAGDGPLESLGPRDALRHGGAAVERQDPSPATHPLWAVFKAGDTVSQAGKQLKRIRVSELRDELLTVYNILKYSAEGTLCREFPACTVRCQVGRTGGDGLFCAVFARTPCRWTKGAYPRDQRAPSALSGWIRA